MTTKIITSMPELLDAIRGRRDELNISHETIDDLAGLQSGYTSKILAPTPIKNLGPMSLGAILGALGIGLIVVEDSLQRSKVESRWCQRKRAHRPGALLDCGDGRMLSSTSGGDDVQADFEFPTEACAGRPDQSGGIGRPSTGEPVPGEPD
jgi:hypothetical protein